MLLPITSLVMIYIVRGVVGLFYFLVKCACEYCVQVNDYLRICIFYCCVFLFLFRAISRAMSFFDREVTRDGEEVCGEQFRGL